MATTLFDDFFFMGGYFMEPQLPHHRIENSKQSHNSYLSMENYIENILEIGEEEYK